MSKTKQKSIEELLEEALVPEEEQPYKVPENWMWVLFEKVVTNINNGKKQIPQKHYQESGMLPVVDQGQKLISGYTDNLELRFSGELPVIIFGDHTKCIKWVDFDFVQGADGTKILKPLELIQPKYLYYLLQNVNLPDRGYSRHFKYLKETPLPIAPLSEQKRIAEKVERLFAKIDEAKRLIEEVKESFELRRAAILDKAFKGQLSTNIPNEKSMLEISNEIKEKDLIPKEEQPYEVPENWVWSKLGGIVTINMGQSPKGEYTTTEKTDYPLIGGPADMGETFPNTVRYTTKPTKLSSPGELIISVRATLGKVNISDKVYCLGRGVAGLSSDQIDMLYLRYYFDLIKDDLSNIANGTTFLQISKNDIENIKIPLPPINEQKRIAEKVSNLLSKLDNEKKLVLDFEEKINLLKQSILNKAFCGELGTNDPTDEHAIELLKEVLKSK
ncbi:restriction endonuclease subunit S [Bacillus smithii]|uniref:restriction endonuclease subunit S n=1 Tax=Bacillus smithii TaxID=1479 RepID=UPI003D20B815